MENIHTRLRRLRLEKGLSHQAVADFVSDYLKLKLPLTYQAVQQWEGGKRPTAPRGAKVDALSALYGISKAELVFGSAGDHSGVSPMGEEIHFDRLNDDEWDLIQGFRHADEGQRQSMLILARSATSAFMKRSGNERS